MKTPLDEFAKLLENPSHDLSVDVYNKNKNGRGKPVKKRNGENRITLAKLAVTVNDLSITVNDLAKEINSRFDNFEKGINTRIDNLEKDINARLDNIEKRLDYNNLKKLPESSK